MEQPGQTVLLRRTEFLIDAGQKGLVSKVGEDGAGSFGIGAARRSHWAHVPGLTGAGSCGICGGRLRLLLKDGERRYGRWAVKCGKLGRVELENGCSLT